MVPLVAALQSLGCRCDEQEIEEGGCGTFRVYLPENLGSGKEYVLDQ